MNEQFSSPDDSTAIPMNERQRMSDTEMAIAMVILTVTVIVGLASWLINVIHH